MTCPFCGNNINDELNFCSECGADLRGAKTNIQPVSPYQPQGSVPPAYTPQPPQQPPMTTPYTGDDYAKSALKFGITGTCFDITVFLSIVGLILGIVGIKKACNASRMGVKTGKQKAGLIMSIISLTLALVLPFVFFAACNSKTDKFSSITSSNTEMSDIEKKLLGTYTGSNNSVLILREDHICNYYYEGFGVSTNDWKVEDGKFEAHLSNVFCNVFAKIDENDTDTIYLESKSSLWDNETFKRVSNDTKGLSEEECAALLGKSKPAETTAATKTTTQTVMK